MPKDLPKPGSAISCISTPRTVKSPISCVLTAASVHDSQVAIPLATITAGRITNLYDLMDSAYDVAAIKQHSRDLNHVPIIDINPRATPGLKQELADEAKRLRLVGHRMAEQVRYGEWQRDIERVNGGLKDNHGGRTVRVRGPDKVMCHLMFGVLSFTVLQLGTLTSLRNGIIQAAPPHTLLACRRARTLPVFAFHD